MAKDFDNLMREKGTCCICGKPMSDSKFVSMAQLDKKAAWGYPVWNNFLIPGLEDRAMAVVCDGCHKAAEISGVSGTIKYAVEFRENEIILHKVEELEDVPHLQEIIKPTENPDDPITGDRYLFTGTVDDPRYGPFLEQKSNPLYWMHETSGKMKQIVFKFMTGAPLSDKELDTMHWYIFQWVDALPVKPQGFSRALIFGMTQEMLSDYIHGPLMDAGIDPL